KIKYEKGLKEDDLLKYLSDQITFRVEDNLGNELALNTGSSFGFSENGEIYIEGNDVFHPVSSEVKAITILPYFNLPKDGKIIETDSEGNEIIVDISKFENTKLEFDSFTVPLTEK